jgi:hypothetical protein
MAGIVTASASNPWLLKIEPGIYDLGPTPLYMSPYVDIEGSGEGVTRLIGSTGGGSPNTGTVFASGWAEMRSLTVESAGTNVHVAIFGAGLVRLTHVTAKATGGDFPIGIYNIYGSPTLTRVTIASSGGAFSS